MEEAQVPTASPTCPMLFPNPLSRPPEQWPSLTSWGGFGRRRKKGLPPLRSFPPPPSLIGSASLEPNFSRSRLRLSFKGAGVQRPREGGAAANLGVGSSRAPAGRGADGVGPRSLQLAASLGPGFSPPPAFSFPPSGGLPPPPPPPPTPPHPARQPATSSRFLIPATSAFGGSFRGRRQPRGESLADAAGAARSRRRLVNGTWTGAGANTAALAPRRGPAARARPPGPQVSIAASAFLPPGWGLLRERGSR